MAMNMMDQTYQPVNIGQGFSEAFARGAAAVPDLGARITELMATSMGQQGAMQRTQVAEQGENKRSTERNQTSLQVAGFGSNGQALTHEQFMKNVAGAGPGTVIKGRLADGTEITYTSDKMSAEQHAITNANTVMKEWMKTAAGEDATDEEITSKWWSLYNSFLTERKGTSESEPQRKGKFSPVAGLGGLLGGISPAIGIGMQMLNAKHKAAGAPTTAAPNTAGFKTTKSGNKYNVLNP